MIEALGGVWSSLTEYPRVSFALFLIIGAGVLFLFSGPKWMESLVGILRVAATIFTTPFEFLRDALTLVRNARESEQDYAKSRIFMLFRYSRLQYLGVLVFSLMLLTAGLTSAVLAFNPTVELEQSAQLRDQIKKTQADIGSAEASLAEIERPGYQEALERTLTQTRSQHQARNSAYRELRQRSRFQGGLVSRIDNAQTAQSAAQLQNGLEDAVRGCPDPYQWANFTAEDCTDFRTYVTSLLEAKLAERTALEASRTAEQAVESASSALATARAELESLQARLTFEREQLDAVSIFRLDWLQDRATAAITILISAALGVVVFIWLGAIVIDVVNWIILIMRSLERTQAEKLENARSDYSE
jgi:hypothetical protein